MSTTEHVYPKGYTRCENSYCWRPADMVIDLYLGQLLLDSITLCRYHGEPRAMQKYQDFVERWQDEDTCACYGCTGLAAQIERDGPYRVMVWPVGEVVR